MIPALGLRSSVVPEFPAGPLRGQCAVPGPASRAGYATGERCPSQDGPSAKPPPLLTHCLLTRPIPASAGRHDQVSEVDGSTQVPVMGGTAVGQVHVRSRFSFGFTLPQALQVQLLGNHMGRVTWVCRHWPLASSSRASSQYPRHLARALDFPGSAHPRQERGGARLSQHGVTAPGDDAGYVDLEGNRKAGCRASFTIPVRNDQSRPVTEHRPPAWGQ